MFNGGCFNVSQMGLASICLHKDWNVLPGPPNPRHVVEATLLVSDDSTRPHPARVYLGSRDWHPCPVDDPTVDHQDAVAACTEARKRQDDEMESSHVRPTLRR